MTIPYNLRVVLTTRLTKLEAEKLAKEIKDSPMIFAAECVAILEKRGDLESR